VKGPYWLLVPIRLPAGCDAVASDLAHECRGSSSDPTASRALEDHQNLQRNRPRAGVLGAEERYFH
jgi:hypothetical protein